MISKLIFLLSLVAASCVFVQAQLEPPNPPQEPPPPLEIKNAHLSCFTARIPEDYQFRALISAFANSDQYLWTVQRCEIKTKFAQLCVPSTKEVRWAKNVQFPDVLREVE